MCNLRLNVLFFDKDVSRLGVQPLVGFFDEITASCATHMTIVAKMRRLSTDGENRTPNLSLRTGLLYPLSYIGIS